MTVVLIDWAELPIDLFFNEIRWDDESFNAIVLFLLLKNVLVERGEGLREAKCVPDTFYSRLCSKFFIIG